MGKRRSRKAVVDDGTRPMTGEVPDLFPKQRAVVVKETASRMSRAVRDPEDRALGGGGGGGGGGRMLPSRNYTATPLRGNAESPLKPYKQRSSGTAQRTSLLRMTATPATAPHGKTRERTQEDIHAGVHALKELIQAIGGGTRMLEFKDMLEVKVAVGMSNHIERLALEDLNSFEKIAEELSMLWKINRADIDVLEHLLHKIGMLERFVPDLERFKAAVRYSELPALSEREATTIIGSLHNLLQASEDANCAYTTICFLHYGDVYSFNRARLNCMKDDLAALLSLHYTQITYIAKVPANGAGYVTLFQMPCSVSRKLVQFTRKNHDTLMSLGLKGIQVTGADGLRYTQSLGYLQDKLPVAAPAAANPTDHDRIAKTAPARSSFPRLPQSQQKTTRTPVLGQATSVKQARVVLPHALDDDSPPPLRAVAIDDEHDRSLLPQVDPNEAKFERRVALVKSTLKQLTKPESEELVNVLLEQIRNLHRHVASLKKDLREKARELNASQGFVQRAEKEIKTMEMQLEARAQQISDTNVQLLKRVTKLMEENVRLKDAAQRMDAELDIHRQLERENRFGTVVRVTRIGNQLQTA